MTVGSGVTCAGYRNHQRSWRQICRHRCCLQMPVGGVRWSFGECVDTNQLQAQVVITALLQRMADQTFNRHLQISGLRAR